MNPHIFRIQNPESRIQNPETRNQHLPIFPHSHILTFPPSHIPTFSHFQIKGVRFLGLGVGGFLPQRRKVFAKPQRVFLHLQIVGLSHFQILSIPTFSEFRIQNTEYRIQHIPALSHYRITALPHYHISTLSHPQIPTLSL